MINQAIKLSTGNTMYHLWTNSLILNNYLPIIDKWVHQQSFFDNLFELGFFSNQVSIVVIRHNYSIVLHGKFQYITIIIADNSFPADSSSRGKNQHLFFFQLE